MSQADLASICGVSLHLIGSLEKLQFPATYRYEEALLIADALDIPVENVLPERMVGWKGQTKFSYCKVVPIDKLLEYKDNRERHLLMESPEIQANKDDNLSRLRLMMKRFLSDKQRRILELRYGLTDAGGPFTLMEVGKKLGITREVVRVHEAKAIQKLQKYAESHTLMQTINKKSLNEI